MEIGLVVSNIDIASNGAATVVSAANSRGQPAFSELMLATLNNRGRSDGSGGEFPDAMQEQAGGDAENIVADLQEMLGLFAGGPVNYINVSQNSPAIEALTVQTQALPNEAAGGAVLTDITGRIVQQPTMIATEWNGAAGRLQSIPAGGELASNTAPAQQMTQAQVPVNEPASNIQSTGHEVQAAETKVVHTAVAESIQRPEQSGPLEQAGKAMQPVQGQVLTEPAQATELNHTAAALKAGPSGTEHTGAALQAESTQPEVRTQPYTQIEKAIASTLQNQGPKEFRLQLQPESLGAIDIKLKLEAGKMTIEIMAAGAKTQALLTGQVDKLVQGLGLQMHNVQIESVQVNSREAEPSSQLQQQSFTANENADMFQKQERQATPGNIVRMSNQSAAGSAPEENARVHFDEGAKYRLNYSV